MQNQIQLALIETCETMHIKVNRKCVQLLLLSFSFSQLVAVLLQQFETELAEDLQEFHICVLFQSLLWFLKCKMNAIPGHTGRAQVQFNATES